MKFNTIQDQVNYLREVLLWGDAEVVNGTTVVREEPQYWKDMRVAYVSGRGSGKTRWQEEVQKLIDKTDELYRLAAGWRLAPSRPVPPVDTAKVRWPSGWWKGWKPSDHRAYLDEFFNWNIPTKEQQDATWHSAADIADAITDWWKENKF